MISGQWTVISKRVASMEETRIGLPNTCRECGNDPGFTWWSEHADAALSGQGYCLDCALEIAPVIADKLVFEALAEDAVVTIADDLTKIKGIGAKRAGILHDLGIWTFEDLAQARAGDLAETIEVSPLTIQDWIETAGALI